MTNVSSRTLGAGRTDAVLGVDLGGTVVKAGVVSNNGEVLSFTTRESGERHGPNVWVAAAIEAAEQARRQSPVPPSALGLSVPGAVDADRRRLLDLVARLPTDEGVDLAKVFATIGLPVWAENDANAALLAEQRWGGLENTGDLVLLTIGTGIGSAVVVDGRLVAGGRPLAGNQVGHFTIELGGATCVCGNRGCAETVASASALVESARAMGLEAVDAAGVFDAEAAGVPSAVHVVERFLDGLTAIVVNAVHAYQPSTVVLAGGVMARQERILPALRIAVADRAWTLPRGRVRIIASQLGRKGSVLAAAAVALSGCESDRGAASSGPKVTAGSRLRRPLKATGPFSQ